MRVVRGCPPADQRPDILETDTGKQHGRPLAEIIGWPATARVKERRWPCRLAVAATECRGISCLKGRQHAVKWTGRRVFMPAFSAAAYRLHAVR
jgi:hypothetical protein